MSRLSFVACRTVRLYNECENCVCLLLSNAHRVKMTTG